MARVASGSTRSRLPQTDIGLKTARLLICRWFGTAVGAALLEGEDAVPVVLHVGHNPFIHCGGVEGFVEATEARVSVVGVFAFRVGVMDNQAKADATGHRRPLQHFDIAIGIAECRYRTAADELIDADRLASLVIDKVEFRQSEKLRPAIAHLELRLDRRSHDLFRRHAVDPLGPRTHELDATT